MEIYWNEYLCHSRDFREIFQLMANRLQVGNTRYGKANARQTYLDRCKKELETYEKTNNQEHIINAANYMILEYLHPQFKKVFHDNTVDSVTRNGKKSRM